LIANEQSKRTLDMPTSLCLVCHFKNTCNKKQDNAEKCTNQLIIKKMLHCLSMSLDDAKSQDIEDEEINILDELLAK